MRRISSPRSRSCPAARSVPGGSSARTVSVTRSGLDWTILRASGLFGAPSVTDYQVTDGFAAGRFTSRTDLADCMLRQLDDDQHVHQALAVATVTGQPGFLSFFLAEGIGKKAA